MCQCRDPFRFGVFGFRTHTRISVLVSYRIVSYRISVLVSYRTRVRHLPRSFSARTRVRHYLYSYRIVSYHTRVCHLPRSFSARTRVRRYLYSYRIVSYRTRISVLGYVTYLIRSLHVLEYVIIRTRIVSYRIVLGYVTYLVRSSARTRVRHYLYSYFRTRVRHLPHSFSARTRVRHYPYSTWVQDKWVQHSLPLVYPLRFPFFLMVTFSPELFTSATVTLLVPVLIVA